MASLFLMTWLSVNGTEAGQAFKNCLVHKDNTTSYNSLLNYPFFNNSDINKGNHINICCNPSQCSLFIEGSKPCADADASSFPFGCIKISQTIFCDDIFCAGIVGETLITSNTTTVDKCPADLSLTIVADYVAKNNADNSPHFY